MSSTELLDAASISMTSIEVALAIETHDSQTPHGSVVGPFSQFRQAARILANDVLPVPREPTNRLAWCTLPCSTALDRVRTTCSWPTTSAKVRGRWRRYSEGADTGGPTSLDTVPAVAARLRAPAAIGALALALWLAWGHGFANYDALYSLIWGDELAHGHSPSFDVALAPTPHPLANLVGLVLAPLSPRAGEAVLVAIAFVSLGTVGWLVYALAERWVGAAARVLAALLFLTPEPVLSYGTRAYVDVPYLALVLGALLAVERRRAPFALLAVAGLLRPEAWLFSGALLWWRWRTARVGWGGVA